MAPRGGWRVASRAWSPYLSLAMTVAIAAIDYVTGPRVHFPVLFVVPVVHAAWNSGLLWGLSVALLGACARTAFGLVWRIDPPVEVALNVVPLAGVFIVLAVFANRAAQQRRQLMREVRTIRGLLPTCSFCKQIRTESGTWERFEKYVAERTDAEFTHGVCPECAKEHYGVDLDPVNASNGRSRETSRRP